MAKFTNGSPVKWKWGAYWAYGEVKKSHTERVEKNIKGSEVVRNGSEDNPAYHIVQEDGGEVLKLESELHKV